jgi:hypothetical protein
MAMILLGQSTCPLCGNILEEKQELQAFPPLTSNKKDSFYTFSDAGFHKECFENHPLSTKISTYYEKASEKTRPNNRFCEIANTLITQPENFFFIDLLTSDENEALSQFNCLLFDKENLKDWKEKDHFLTLAKDFLAKGKWQAFDKFNYLEWLINQVENSLQIGIKIP